MSISILDYDRGGSDPWIGTRAELGTINGWSALHSSDWNNRYILKRPIERLSSINGKSDWETRPPERDRTILVSCGQNPSVASAMRNDSTVRKELGFALRWQLGRYIKVNAYSWKATDPDDLWKAAYGGADILGHHNDLCILTALLEVKEHGGIALAAWGNDIEDKRQDALIELAKDAGVQWQCLGKNKNGSPKHSLYPSYKTPLVPWP